MKTFKKSDYKSDNTETLKLKLKKGKEILENIKRLTKKRKELVEKLMKLPNERNN